MSLTPPHPHQTRPAEIKDHELLRPIAEGSYGQIWLARNVMGTYRAVKIVYRDAFKDSRPFERELEGIQRFEPISRSHEGFVDVLQVGQNLEDGYFYYVMELGDDHRTGQRFDLVNYAPKTLATEVTALGRLPVQKCVQLGISLAAALSHLHTNGLTHRDIKPSNIIFVDGVPKLADIGLVTDIGEKCSVVGTTGYIPPEGPGTPTADIYSLGKLLYEISTGRDRKEFPELSADLMESADVKDFMEINEVVRRACQSDPRKRYQSASDIQAELTVLLNGESIRRLRFLEKRWAGVKKLGSVLTILVLAAAGAGYLVYNEQKRTDETRQIRAGANVGYGTSLLEEGHLLEALPFFAEALRLSQGNWKEEADYRLRCGTVLAQSPKLAQLWRQSGVINYASFSPDGMRIVTSPQFDTAQVWDAETGRPVSPRVLSGRSLKSAFYSPDGRLIVIACMDNTVRVIDTPAGNEVLRLNHPWEVFCGKFSPDGRRILTTCRDGQARVWDATTGMKLMEFGGHGAAVFYATYSPKGRFIVTTSFDTTARLWDATTGEPRGGPLKHPNWLYHAGFSPDEKYLVTACHDGKGRVWDVASGSQVYPMMQHEGPVHSAEFSPDGRFIVTASLDTYVRIWDAATLQPVKSNPRIKHSGRVLHAGFAPDGHRIVTCCTDGTTRVWDMAANDMIPRRVAGIFSADAARFATTNEDRVIIWDTSTEHAAGPPIKPRHNVRHISLNHRGTLLLTDSGANDHSSELQMWDAITGKPISVSISFTNGVAGSALSEDGQHLATFTANKAQIWHGVADQPTSFSITNPQPVKLITFSPDGRFVMIVCGNRVQLRDSVSGKEMFPVLTHLTDVSYAEFNPAGDRFVTGFQDSQWTECWAQVWDGITGRPVGKPLRHRDGVLHASFSLDNARVVTGSEDSTATVWDAATGRAITPPLNHEDQVEDGSFSSDGRWVVTASADRTARIWNATRGDPIAPPLRHPWRLISARFIANNTKLFARDVLGNGWLWNLPRQQWSIGDIVLLAQLVSSQRGLDVYKESGDSTPGTESLRSSYQYLKSKYPTAFTTSQAELIYWHQQAAEVCEKEKRWLGAVFNLNRLLMLDPNEPQLTKRLGLAKENLAKEEPPRSPR